MWIIYEFLCMRDVEMYVHGFTKLNAATRLCMHVRRMYVMFTHLSTQTLQRENVHTYVCMYVSDKVCL